METTKEPVMKKGKRPKSATRYPKRMPTYVVAFAVQETHDEPSKSQIPSKRSIESTGLSANSISPTGSTHSSKTFTITPTEKNSLVLDLDVPTISEVKIDIIDDNQYGDVEKKCPQLNSYIIVDNRTAEEQPEILFNASKHIRQYKDNNKFPRKKSKKNRRVIKFKNVHFKYKNLKNNITRRLERYYEKSKINSPNFYCNVVSRSRVLKKVLAKENLLDDADQISMFEGVMNEYDDGSLNSSPSTTKRSFVSYTSQNTLVRKSSSSSKNEDFYSMKAVNSVIQVSSELAPLVTPYKTDVINVAVAVAYGSHASSKPNNNQNSSDEKFLHKENLTSDEIFEPSVVELTSETPSEDENGKYLNIDYDQLVPITLNEKDLSSETLTGFEKKSVMGVCSENDTYVIARTSSDFNKSLINYSDYTSNSESIEKSEFVYPNLLSKDDFKEQDRTTLLDRVKKLGFFPEMTPSTSSEADFENDTNNVIVTEALIDSFPLNLKKKDDDHAKSVQNNFSNVLRKSFDVQKLAFPQKISLPNDVMIKAKLNETEKVHRKTCSEGVKTDNYPTDLREIWDQLTLLLDSAVKRLEDNLAQNIIKELKKSEIFTQHEYRLTKYEMIPTENAPAQAKYSEPTAEMLHKEVLVTEDNFKVDADESVQCDLVDNKAIDQLMLKLSVEGPKPPPVTSSTALNKLTRPQIVRDYFEILKPPITQSALVEIGRGDTVTVSTATAEFRIEEFRGLQRLKILFAGPMAFIRENLFVITSIPTFFIVLLCFYGIIVIIMKPY